MISSIFDGSCGATLMKKTNQAAIALVQMKQNEGHLFENFAVWLVEDLDARQQVVSDQIVAAEVQVVGVDDRFEVLENLYINWDPHCE